MNFLKKALILILLPIIFLYISSSISSNVVNAAAPYKISGYVFVDTNGNGTKDSGESISNTSIKIEKWKDPSVPKNHTYSANEQNYETMDTGTLNQSAGHFLFIKLTGGPSYKLKANVPQGFKCSPKSNCNIPSINLNKDKEFIFGIQPTTVGGKCTETTPTIHITSANGSQSTPQGGTATYPLSISNTNNPANCQSGGSYTLSITAANGLPTGVAIDPTTTSISGVYQGHPRQINLKINTTANTPTKNANHAYDLILHATNTANSAKKATNGITLTVTSPTNTTKYSCNSTTHACSVSANGTYASQATCETACAASTCTNGTKQCSATGIPQTCTNNTWVNGTACTTGQTCSAGDCIEGTQTGASSLSFIVGLDDIGATGDNSSDEFITPVVAPAHLSQPLKIELFAGTDDETAAYTVNGTLNYAAADPNLGKFTSDPISLPDNFVPGNYIVKITVPGHLIRQIPGIQNIQAGDNSMASVNLVTGDIDGNNSLDIHDYSILIGCSNVSHGDSDTALCNSNTNYKLLSDLNDDGTDTTPKVDHFDVSILGREFYVQNGD